MPAIRYDRGTISASGHIQATADVVSEPAVDPTAIVTIVTLDDRRPVGPALAYPPGFVPDEEQPRLPLPYRRRTIRVKPADVSFLHAPGSTPEKRLQWARAQSRALLTTVDGMLADMTQLRADLVHYQDRLSGFDLKPAC